MPLPKNTDTKKKTNKHYVNLLNILDDDNADNLEGKVKGRLLDHA